MVKSFEYKKILQFSAFYKIAMNFCFWLFNLVVVEFVFYLLNVYGVKHNSLDLSVIWNFKQILLFSISFIFMFAFITLRKHKNKSSSSDEDFFINIILNQFSGVLTNFASLTIMLALARGIPLSYILLSLVFYFFAYYLDSGKEDI